MSPIHCRSRALGLAVVVFGGLMASLPAETQAVDAVFELRKAATEPDWDLKLDISNDKLDLEIWMELKNNPTNLKMVGYSFFLDIDPGETGVIQFDPISFADQAGMTPFPPQGIDNSPESGDVSRGAFSFMGTSFGSSGPQLLATFSVQPIGQGQVTYAFANVAPQRVWEVTIEGGGSANVTVLESPQAMTVHLPEPGLAGMMLVGLAMIAKRRRCFSC